MSPAHRNLNQRQKYPEVLASHTVQHAAQGEKLPTIPWNRPNPFHRSRTNPFHWNRTESTYAGDAEEEPKEKRKKGTDVDSWAGASTSLNLLTSGIASVCIAATRPEQSRNTRRLSEARNRAEQSLRKEEAEEAAGDRVTYDDEGLGDWACFGSHGRRCET
jgi:hypothetical protein